MVIRLPPPQAPPGYDPASYPPVGVSVDVVVLTLSEGQLHVVLIQRGAEPHQDAWALPGGFIHTDETLDQAAARELSEETGIDATAHLEQFGTYGDPGRDPRMRVVTVAYLAILRDVGTLVASTDAARAELVPVHDLLAAEPARPLAFDHRRILEDGIARAREKLASTSLATAFIGPEFTLSDLRTVYEAAWGVRLDPGNFRRKVLSTEGFVEPTGRSSASGPGGGKPAETYTSEGVVPLHPPMQPMRLASALESSALMRSSTPSNAPLSGRTVWRVRLWDDPPLQEAMLTKGVIAIGGDELPDLSARPSDEKLARKLHAAFPKRTKSAIAIFIGYWRAFLDRMQPGDFVLAPLAGRRVAIGRVRGGYRYNRSAAEPRLRHTRRVEWLRITSRDVLADDVRAVVDAPGTIGSIRALRSADDVEDLLSEGRGR
jgi:8-oxo-dGTP diphosphatase